MPDSKVLPYLVPPGYIEGQTVSPDGLVRHLGHDVYVMLVHDLNGLCRNVLPEEVPATVPALYEEAIENLVALVKAGEIRLAVIKGPRGLPLVVAGGHWTAAACILLPRLFKMASEQLGTPDLLAAVPSRGSLLVFPRLDDAYIKAMWQFIRRAERGEAKLVSNSLFRLTAQGALPFGPTVPPRSASFLRRLFGG
jgi:hypothetical protein